MSPYSLVYMPPGRATVGFGRAAHAARTGVIGAFFSNGLAMTRFLAASCDSLDGAVSADVSIVAPALASSCTLSSSEGASSEPAASGSAGAHYTSAHDLQRSQSAPGCYERWERNRADDRGAAGLTGGGAG
jgi:hypothetical protein